MFIRNVGWLPTVYKALSHGRGIEDGGSILLLNIYQNILIIIQGVSKIA
jgi:hypothetical protein